MSPIHSSDQLHQTLSVMIFALIALLSTTNAEPRILRAAFPLDTLRSVTQGDAKVASDILLRKIVEEKGFTYNITIPESHAEFIPAMQEEEYDFFIMFGYEFLRFRNRLGLKPILIGSRTNDSPLNTLVLVTKKTSGIADAKNRPLLIQQGSGLLSHIWLSKQMEKKGLEPPEDYFEEIREVNSVSQAVLPVFFGKAGAGLVTMEGLETLAELNPQIEQNLEKTFVSEPLLTSLLCVRKGYPQEDTETIRRTAIDLHKRPEGGQILTMMRVEKLVSFETKYLVSLEALINGDGELTENAKSSSEPKQ